MNSKTEKPNTQTMAMKAEGIDVCSFGAGEPDFDTPDHIKQACAAALTAGYTKYTPSSGILELRQAISEKFKADNHLDYAPGQVVVSNGAKHSCLNAILACVGPGDEVIIPAPFWVSYPEMVRIAGGQPVIVSTKEENGWKMTAEEFEDAMTPRTKMVILNSPGNPTGAVYSEQELRAIGEVATGEDIYILSDEIYEKLVYDDVKHVSIAALSKEFYDLTITVNGFSKSYAMTGWRLAGADREGDRRDPEPLHERLHELCAERRDRRAQGRSAGGRGHADGVRHAAPVHGGPAQEHPAHEPGRAAGRVLRAGKRQRSRPQLDEFLGSPAQQASRRGRSGRRVRR
jgi:aspartate/methionine/tyrosine aminotransferase